MIVDKFDIKKLERETEEEFARKMEIQAMEDEEEARRLMEADSLVTVENLKMYMPKGFNDAALESIVEEIKKIEEVGIDSEDYAEKLLSYTHLLGPGIGMRQLMNAMKFVTLLFLPKMTQTRAYELTFPKKYAERRAKNMDCSSFASEYARTKLVIEIQKSVMLTPAITHAPLANKLLYKLVDLSNGIGAKPDDYVSPTVQLEATKAAYDIVKQPEETTIKIGLDEKSMSVTEGLMHQIAKQTELQMQRLEAGEDISSVQKLGISTDKILEAHIEE